MGIRGKNAVKPAGTGASPVEYRRFAQKQMLIFVKDVANWLDVCYTVDTNTREVPSMANYEKMYAILCSAASDAVNLLESCGLQQAIELLKEGLLQTETMYIEG